MNKKKLSHSGLQSSVTSVLAALLCIVIGMAVGFLVLLAINPAHAWGDGFVRIIKGGFHDAPYGVGKELANAAPLIMTGLSVGLRLQDRPVQHRCCRSVHAGRLRRPLLRHHAQDALVRLPASRQPSSAASGARSPASSRPTSTSTRSSPPSCSTGSACIWSMSSSTRTAPAPCTMCATPVP